MLGARAGGLQEAVRQRGPPWGVPAPATPGPAAAFAAGSVAVCRQSRKDWPERHSRRL